MELTLIGAAELLGALGLFVFCSVRALFILVMMATLLGGSAAIYLTALGGSSISPAHLALGLLMLRCLMPERSDAGGVGAGGVGAGSVGAGDFAAGIRENAWLVVFALYAIIAAMLLPRLFAGEIDVTPLRGQVRPRYASQLARILATEPLHFTTQNLTTAVYIAGTLAMALVTFAAMRRDSRNVRLFARAGAVIGIVHALSGIAGVALRGTPLDLVFAFFRNNTYAQLDHEWGGFVRMNGLWPEASSFASFAITWFAFNFECWLRRIEARWSGPAALLLGLALIASTSSTAYVGLAIFGAIFALRLIMTPRLMPLDRMAWLTLALLLAVTVTSLLMVLEPAMSAAMRRLFEHMTFDKAGSFSGRQRLFWASQGIDAFAVSHGLGIGPGSFRSSSLVASIIGSMGVVGLGSFLLYLVRACAPLALSTYRKSGDPNRDIAAACRWALIVSTAVASVSAPSCDPGLTFAALAGAAIALRRAPQARGRSAIPFAAQPVAA